MKFRKLHVKTVVYIVMIDTLLIFIGPSSRRISRFILHEHHDLIIHIGKQTRSAADSTRHMFPRHRGEKHHPFAVDLQIIFNLINLQYFFKQEFDALHRS